MEETELDMEAKQSLSFRTKGSTRKPTEWQTVAEEWGGGQDPDLRLTQAKHPLFLLPGFH